MAKRSANRATSLDRTTSELASASALNWGLAGLFSFNLVSAVLGKSPFSRIVYTLVGLSGAYLLSTAKPES